MGEELGLLGYRITHRTDMELNRHTFHVDDEVLESFVSHSMGQSTGDGKFLAKLRWDL